RYGVVHWSSRPPGTACPHTPLAMIRSALRPSRSGSIRPARPAPLRRRVAAHQEEVVVGPVPQHGVQHAQPPPRHRHDRLLPPGPLADPLVHPPPRRAVPHRPPRRLHQRPPQDRRARLGDRQVLPLVGALPHARHQPGVGADPLAEWKRLTSPSSLTITSIVTGPIPGAVRSLARASASFL